MSPTPQEELRDYILRVKSITSDCRTFLWARLQHYDDLNNQGLGLGGGNLLMANGLFSSLGYLGKIYVQLMDTAEWHRNRIKEGDAFQKLINACPEKLGLDTLSGDDVKAFWGQWRNGLAHMVVQTEVGTAMTIMPPADGGWPSGQYEEYKLFITSGQRGKSFTKRADIDWWDCNVDVLTSEVDKIALWVFEQCSIKPDRVGVTLKWLKGELAAKKNSAQSAG